MKSEYASLVNAAAAVRTHSYSPYSHFRVGAALLTRSGRVHVGTNVENASFGLAICAERSAVVSAIAAGDRDFVAMAICADGETPTAPCGACRQVLLEFGPQLPVILAGERGLDGEVRELTMAELLPHAFFDFTAKLRQPDSAGSAEGTAEGTREKP